MTRDRVRAQEEFFGDLLVRQSVGSVAQHVDLALAQSVRWTLSRLRRGFTDVVPTLRKTRQDLTGVRSADATERVDRCESRCRRRLRVVDVLRDELRRDVRPVRGQSHLEDRLAALAHRGHAESGIRSDLRWNENGTSPARDLEELTKS